MAYQTQLFVEFSWPPPAKTKSLVLSSLLQVLAVLRKNAADKRRVWNCAGEKVHPFPAHIVDAHQEKMELLEFWNGWNTLRDLSIGGFLGLNRQES